MPTKIILNTTPPLDLETIGFFGTFKESNHDAQREKQIVLRFETTLKNGGPLALLQAIEVPIKGQLFNSFITQQTVGGKTLAAEVRDLSINFVLSNGLLDGVAA